MGMLTRLQLFLGIFVSLFSCWYAALSIDNDPSLLLKYAPIWMILMLGLYAVLSIAGGVVQCKDFPDAAREIEKQVKEAKIEMSRRGVISQN